MIQMLTSVIGQRGVDAMAFLLAFALTALTDSIFRDKLPHDHGRAFAVNGELSKGKARGSGLIFVLCIALVSLAFLPFNTEYVVYNVLLIASMLSGYLDDAAETAWNEYKKGIIDFVIAVLAGVTYLNFNGCAAGLPVVECQALQPADGRCRQPRHGLFHRHAVAQVRPPLRLPAGGYRVHRRWQFGHSEDQPEAFSAHLDLEKHPDPSPRPCAQAQGLE